MHDRVSWLRSNRMKGLFIFLSWIMIFSVNLSAEENEDAQKLFNQAQLATREGDHAKAVMGFTKVLALKLDKRVAAGIYQERGEAHFKLAKIKESISDFDAYLKVYPERDPHHWMRGISYYYADEFRKGYEQFERHQTVNSNDVENAVWHYLCLSRAKGVEAARKKLIPIVGDGRIPMMEVHSLFAGQSTPEKVLAKARAGDVKGALLERQLFYAHLYLGIWHETNKEFKLRDKYIALAAAVASNHGYMGDVARVHAELNKIKVSKGEK